MFKNEKIKFIENVFGPGRLSANEQNIAVSCPICNNHDRDKKKLSIRLEDDLNHCWVCGWSSYNLLPLLLKIKANSYIEVYKNSFMPKSSRKNKLLEQLDEETPTLPLDYKLLHGKYASIDPDIKVIFNYLKLRNVSNRDIAYYCLGTSDDIRYKRRIIMPSFDAEGNINYFVARTIDSNTFPKYINSKNKKTNIIFNELKLDWKKQLIIVEGPFDLIKCPDNSTCILGSELNENSKLFAKILENNTPVILCLDEDAISKTLRIANKLSSYNIFVKICKLPVGKDPGSIAKDELEKIIDNSVSYSQYDQISSKIKKINTTLAF